MMSVEAVHYPAEGNDACFRVEDRSFWFQHRNRVIAALLDRFPLTGPFADVGGGNGCVAAYLASRGHRVLMIEPMASGCANARARGIGDVREGTLADAGLTAGEIGAVGAFDVVEHLDDPVGFCRTAFALLPAGGRLFITVPAFRWLWSQADDEAEHRTRYTRRSLERVVTAAGFRMDFSSYLFAPLVFPVFLLRALPYRLGIRRSSSLDTVSSDHERTVPGLALELGRISAGRAVHFGGSVVLVASKPPS